MTPVRSNARERSLFSISGRSVFLAFPFRQPQAFAVVSPNMSDSRDSQVIERLTHWTRRIGLWAGPALWLLIVLFLHPAGMDDMAVRVAGVTLWIAIWWITECVPLPVTSLLPIVYFPLTGILDLNTTTASYAHPLVFLYIGGFMIAIAIEKTGLHARLALLIIRRMGTQLRMIVLGFMLATAFLSMWISNTATALMMLPIGLAILKVGESTSAVEMGRFQKSLMLAIAYAASIGGVATLIGTPPNVVMYGVVRDMYEVDLSFGSWLIVALPLAGVVLMAAWLYITRIGFPLGHATLPGGREEMDRRLSDLGPMSFAERSVTLIFSLTAIAWIIRSFVLDRFIPGIDDTIIAMVGGLVLFLLPSGQPGRRAILGWSDMVKMPWGIVFLFGGGLALAEAFESSGLAEWIGQGLAGFSVLGTLWMILLVLGIVNLLTEFTSNVATVTMILPVLAPIAASAGIQPIALMAGATMVASYGFMMPAGTPPNAIVFGSGYLSIRDMVRTGAVLNLLSVLLVTALVYFVLDRVWGL